MSEIYEPAEDSYLMSRALEKKLPKLLNKNPWLRFLEIGVGSGINLQTVIKKGVNIKNILGSDINPEAVKYCKSLGFNCIVSDLFSNIEGIFDIIAFNPPYLPLDKREPENSRKATTGGKIGNEITIKFLKQAKKHLTKQGRIFVIASSLSSPVDFNKLGYSSREVNNKKLFFERLSVWELTLNID